MDKVSIIVPVYNVEKYVKRCLESLINQTYQNIEIIIVNDGSTDNSKIICEEYVKKDSRIKLVNKENQGLGLARNTGLENITGDYVLFVDSDDYIERDLVETTYNLIRDNNCDFVRFHNYREDLNTGEKKVRASCLNEGLYNREEINENILFPIIGVLPNETRDNFVGMSVWRNLYKVSIIQNNNLKFVSEREFISEDVIFNINYFSLCSKAYVINKPLYHYIVNESSLTSKYKPDRFDKEVIMFKEVIRILKEKNICKDYKIREQRTFLDRTRMCIKQEFARKNVKISEIRKNVLKIFNNIEVKKILNEYPINLMRYDYKIVLFLMKHKMFYSMYLIYLFTKKI